MALEAIQRDFPWNLKLRGAIMKPGASWAFPRLPWCKPVPNSRLDCITMSLQSIRAGLRGLGGAGLGRVQAGLRLASTKVGTAALLGLHLCCAIITCGP